MTPTVFRVLLSLAITLTCLGAVADIVFPGLLPAELAKASEDLPPPVVFTSLIPGVGIATWALLSFVSLIGLFFFKRWSRTTLLACTLVGFVFYPALGPAVNSWASQALTDASFLVLGAVLAVAYTEPLNTRFARSDDA